MIVTQVVLPVQVQATLNVLIVTLILPSSMVFVSIAVESIIVWNVQTTLYARSVPQTTFSSDLLASLHAVWNITVAVVLPVLLHVLLVILV